MAAIRNKQARRLAGLALAISAFTLPAVAQADPSDGGRGGWRGRSEEGGRQERPQNQGNPGWRVQQQQQPEQVRQAPAPPAAPQAQAQWQGRADRGSRGNWGGNVAPQAAPVPQPAQQGWNGGNRQDWQNRDRQQAERQQAERAPAWSGNREQWQNRDRQQADRTPAWNGTQAQQRNWNDGDRRDRDGDHRDRNWSRDRNTGGYVQGGRYYGNSGGYDRNYRDRDHDGDRDGRQWNRQWRNNSSYNWYGYRASHPSYYRLGSYYAPYRNYSYRRLSIGFYLDQLFFSQNYWIDNPEYYRLPEVYGPYRWVRYYDDAVLVDIYSGEVVDVINDFFW
ncbi:MAG: RcnB family protein [Novosphingobium sp.]